MSRWFNPGNRAPCGLRQCGMSDRDVTLNLTDVTGVRERMPGDVCQMIGHNQLTLLAVQ